MKMFRRFRARSVCPLARTDGLSVTVSGDETLVYDREQYVIHRLNADTAVIWRLADGSRDLAALAAEAKLSKKAVEGSLAGLANIGLVTAESLGKSAVTRRRLIGGAAGAAAAMAFIAPVAASRIEGVWCGHEYKYTGEVCTHTPPKTGTGIWQCDSGIWNTDKQKNDYFWHCR